MTTKCSELPWSKRLIQVNLIALIIAMVFSTYMLLIKSWIFVIIYWIAWGLYFTVGRYVSCRHCEFYGKPCTSWCMGLIGGKLYKRSEKKHIFEDKGMLKMMFFDVSFFVIAALLPVIVYIYYFFISGLSLIDLILLTIYGLIAIVVFLLHQIGCNKCPLKQCPMNKSKEK